MNEPDQSALSPKQAQAAAAIASGATSSEAAEAVGVTSRSVKRWRAEPVFRAEISRLTTEGLARAVRVLATGAAEAAELLCAVAAGKVRADQGRINAARLVLTLAPGMFDAVELGERVAALENEVAPV